MRSLTVDYTGLWRRVGVASTSGVSAAPRRVQASNPDILARAGGNEMLSAYWIWWIAAEVLIAAALGTFFMLMGGGAVACGGPATIVFKAQER
jgi:hypothetical protein